MCTIGWTPPKPEQTFQKIEEQIQSAYLGVAAAVELLQTESGVKDKIAAHWIQLLTEKARAMQKAQVFNRDTRDPRLNDSKIKGEARDDIKQSIIDAIQEELYSWVILQPQDQYAKLGEESRKISVRINMSGMRQPRPGMTNKGHYLRHDSSVLLSMVLTFLHFVPTTCFSTRIRSSGSILKHSNNSLFSNWTQNYVALPSFSSGKQMVCSEKLILWNPEIKDMEKYLSTGLDLQVFGCWNAVFRLCSVLSNHQTPSLDICQDFGRYGTVQAQLSGGWWKPEGGDWTQAGPKTALGSIWNNGLAEPGNLSRNWTGCKCSISLSKNLCFPGSWIFFSDRDEGVTAGQIVKILVPEGSLSHAEAIVVVTSDYSLF
ncbi:hypothetical protein DFH07DRAFT_772651 [Mycena maculata]|uniref:Uncharacterized protein n=1 Tax=Mycena maculata TaxID=230809 RepID=A0AAD7J752_9AGAR|nr:hypothetical protein DFH07DRAFT_772651 [Mycena maculata]